MESRQSDKVMSQLNDLIEHKKYVLTSCNKMAKWLFANGETDLALKIIQRALVHDNSKFENGELQCLIKISETNDSLTNADYILTDDDKKCIELHWKNNRHHPEHFSAIENMEELDIIEMVCDWYSRSLQLGTNFMEFVYTRQENRFHFPKEMFNLILKYCNILMQEEGS